MVRTKCASEDSHACVPVCSSGCSLLQLVAACCSVLQRVEMRPSVLQRAAVCCGMCAECASEHTRRCVSLYVLQ